MKKQKQHLEFEAYLNDTLSEAEQKEMKLRLQEDSEIQKAFFIYAMGTQQIPDEDSKRLNKILQKVRKQNPLQSIPKANWIDRIRLKLFDKFNWIFGLAFSFLFLVLITILIWANFALPSFSTLAQKHFQEAYCPGVAGAQEQAEFYLAASIYCTTEPDIFNSLQVLVNDCTGFCIAEYYLGHQAMKQGDFRQANLLLTNSLSQEAALRTIESNIDINAVQFNLILCNLLTTGDKETGIRQLESLKEKLPESSFLSLEIMELLKAMKNPLRVLIAKPDKSKNESNFIPVG